MGLQREDWLHAAWNMLVHQGVDSVRVEVLARDLHVSKGSFYWHFQNRAELLDLLLKHWEESSIRLLDTARQAPTPAERLIRLFDLVLETVHANNGRLPDPAIFLWSKHDPLAAASVQTVERRWLMYFTETLCDHGFEPEDAERRAEICYLAFLGYTERTQRQPPITRLFHDFSRSLTRLLLATPDGSGRQILLDLPDEEETDGTHV
jgi:AcrR family transcriptional regulator